MLFRTIFYSIFIAVFIIACSNNKDTHSYVAKLNSEKKFEEILSVYKVKTDEFHKDHWLMNNLGLAYYNLGEYAKAIECYDKAINMDKFVSIYYSNKAMPLIELDDFKNASVLCDKAISLDENNYHAYINRSYAFIKLKKWDWAFEDLNKAILVEGVSDEDMGIAYANLSTIYLNTNRDKGALEYANKAIDLNREVHWAYENRAFLNLKNGQTKEAMDDLEKGLQLKPKNIIMLYYKGLVLTKTGNAEAGCGLMNQALVLIKDASSDKYKTISQAIQKYCGG